MTTFCIFEMCRWHPPCLLLAVTSGCIGSTITKALAWYPFQSNLLATGGGGSDRCIKFWNTHTGACLNSVDTGSQVCSLLWNKNERELLSSHGFTHNQLTLWKYPSMVKMAELTGHTSRVLFMAQVNSSNQLLHIISALSYALV